MLSNLASLALAYHLLLHLLPLASCSCCARSDSGAQAVPQVVELRCVEECVGWTGEFWLGGRAGVGWSAGGRRVLHVVEYEGERRGKVQASMYVSMYSEYNKTSMS